MKDERRSLLAALIGAQVCAAIACTVAAFVVLPYGYYQLLRVLVTTAASAAALFFFREQRQLFAWLMVFIALLFNPVTPVALGRSLWRLADIGSAVVFAAAADGLRRLRGAT